MRQRCARPSRCRLTRGAMLLQAALALAALLVVTAASARDATHPEPSGLRILYASDWAGPMEIFAADPSGSSPVRQVTFGRPPDECRWAAACGFSDQSHMTRTFARQFGFTPGAWQRAAARACRPLQ